MIKITIPSKYIKRSILGAADETIPELVAYSAQMTNVYGILPKSVNGISTSELLDDAEADFDIDHLRFLSQVPGAIVEGFKAKAYFKVSDMNISVPDYLPNSITSPVLDDDGVEIEPARQKTWAEWVLPNYTIDAIEEDVDGVPTTFYWFLNYAGTGYSLPSDIILKLFDESGIELINSKPEII